jgi:hypothetical protein
MSASAIHHHSRQGKDAETIACDIHRWGWEIELLPDGSVRAYGPRGQVLRSHGPPTAQAA